MASRIYESIRHIQDNKEDTVKLLFERLIDTHFPTQIIKCMQGNGYKYCNYNDEYYEVYYWDKFNDGETKEIFDDITSRFEKLGIKCSQRHDNCCSERLDCDRGCNVALECYIHK